MYEEILKKYKYTPASLKVPGQNNTQLTPQDRANQIDMILSGKDPENQAQQPDGKRIDEKILGFTGGDVIAKGIGQGLADTNINISGIAPGESVSSLQNQIQQGQGEQQQKLIEAIRKGKASGKDTSKLEGMLKELTNQISQTGNTAEQYYNPNQITEKQIAGDALQLATTIGSIGTYGTAAKGSQTGKLLTKKLLNATNVPTSLNTLTKATGLLKGAGAGSLKGAAEGLVIGGSSGVSQGLKNDLTASEIAQQGVEGALIGGATGGVLGAITGGISGKIKSIPADKEQKLFDRITPTVNELTPTEYEKLLSQGKITPKTATQPAQYILSDAEKTVARKYSNLLQSKDPVQNSIKVINEISSKDEAVGKFLEKASNTRAGIFNKGELRNNLLGKLDGITDITVDENRLKQAKISLVDNFVKNLDKNNVKNLWQARKNFDRQIEKAFSGSPNLQNTLKREFRNAVQDFISERTNNTTYKGYMKDMTELFDLQDVLSTKATKEKNYSKFSLWLKNNPKKAKALGLSASAVVGGGVVNAIKD